MTDLERIILKLSSREQLDAVEIAKATFAIRAHMEAMKQEPVGYLYIHPEMADRYQFSFMKMEGMQRYRVIPLYTAPPQPAEQPVLKVPVFDEMYYRDALEQIIAMNPHLKVEEVK